MCTWNPGNFTLNRLFMKSVRNEIKTWKAVFHSLEIFFTLKCFCYYLNCFALSYTHMRYFDRSASVWILCQKLHVIDNPRVCAPACVTMVKVSQWNMCAKFNLKMLPQLLAYVITMATNFSPFLKKFLAHLHLKASWHVNPISFELLVKCLFFSFWNNMLLPWQRTSRHCPKMCHAQLHFSVNMYAKFDLKCISPSIFGIICHYHGNTLSSTVKKCVLHNCTYGHHVCQISL